MIFFSRAQKLTATLFTILLSVYSVFGQNTRTFQNTATGRTGSNTNNSTGTLGSTPTLSNGIYSFTVPASGIYSVEVWGAAGGAVSGYTSRGGHGAKIYAEVSLTQNQVLSIVVGQKGGDELNTGFGGGGGGGGSFVYTGSVGSSGLILAAGGGSGAAEDNQGNGVDGQTTRNSNFNGGLGIGNGGGSVGGGGGGAGWLSNGTTGTSGSGTAGGGERWNGGASSGGGNDNNGGFGGGGAGNDNESGGGGGYTGGAGSGNNGASRGAGGSFILSSAANVKTSNGTYDGSSTFNGSPIGNINSYNSDHGRVIITQIKGSITIVSTPGDPVNSGWTYSNGLITATQNVNIDAADIASYLAQGNVTIDASQIIVNESITSTVAGRSLTLKSDGAITLAASKSINTNGGDVIFWANVTNATSGTAGNEILINPGASISTNGGAITLAGGPADVNGKPAGYAYRGVAGATQRAGVALGDLVTTDQPVVSLNSGGGNIIIRGETGGSSGHSGIETQGNFKIDAGAGTITMDGKSAVSHGIDFGNGQNGALAGVIRSQSNATTAISIVGNTTQASSVGIFSWDGDNADSEIDRLLIQSEGTGAINIQGGNVTPAIEGVVLYTGGQILSASGAITITGSGTTWDLKFDGMVFGSRQSANPVQGITPLATSSSAITLNGNNINLNTVANTVFNGTGLVTISSRSNLFSSSFSTNNLSFASTLTGLTLGKSTNTQNITFGSPISITGPIMAYGGSITVNENLNTTTGGVLGDVVLKGTGNITLAASKSITTAGGNVIFWADADASSGGSISLGSAAALQTAGGRIVLAGGLDNGTNGGTANDAIPDGYARGIGVPGIGTTTSFNLDAGNGSILARGSSDTKDGILLSASSTGNLISSGGFIDLNGFVDAGTVTSGQIQSGIRTIGGGTITLDSGTGLINLVGNGPRHGIGFGITDAVVSDDATQTLLKSANTTSNAIKIKGTVGAGGHGISFRGASTKLHATAALGGITIDATAPGWSTTLYNPLEVLAVSGPIVWLNSDATDGIYTQTSSIALGSKAGVTGLTSSSSNITFNLKKVSGNLNLGIGTTGNVTIQGVNGTAAFGQAFNTSDFGLNANSQTMSAFTFGSPANTQTIGINTALTVAGPVTAYGGSIAVNENLNTSMGAALGDILLKASNNITQADSKSVTTAGGDIVYWADSDGNGSGYIQAFASSSIQSGGGDITLGGGTTLATGYARGAATVDNSNNVYISGVHLMSSTSINSSGGNITLRGQNIGNSGAYVQAGIMGMGTTLNAGSGKVSLVGVAGGSGSANSQGISIKGFNEGWNIQSSNPDSDAIVLLGDASTTANASTSLGINFAGSIVSTGGGGISMEGKAGPASVYDQGMDIRGDILANSGTITLIGQNDVASQTAIFFALNPVLGFKAGTSVTASSSNIILKGDNSIFNTTTSFNTTGSVSILPRDASTSFGVAQTLGANASFSGGVSGLTIGKSGNTAGLTIGTARTIAGPVSLFGGAIAINAPLTATNNTISITSTTSLTDGASGYLIANGLALNGAGTVTLDHADNDINTIAGGSSGARIGALSFFDKDDLTIGSVNPSGIYSSGEVKIETGTGDINLTEPVNTTSNTTTATGYAGAIVLNAGKTAAAGTATGGDIKVSGNGAISATSGITKLYSGSSSSSTGLSSLVGGESNARNGVDELTSTFTPVLSTTGGSRFALYRQNGNNALYTDGVNDFVLLSRSPIADGAEAFTIELWINPDGTNFDDTDYHGFIGFEGSGGVSGRNPSLWLKEGKIHLDAARDGDLARFDLLTERALVTQDRWTHVALVKDGAVFKVYLDGSLAVTTAAPNRVNISTNNYWIGRVDNYFSGSIDEVRFWNDARTETEINALMNVPAVGNEAGLVAYYDFNQGVPGANNSGVTTLVDKTSGNNSGTLTNVALSGNTSNWVNGFFPKIMGNGFVYTGETTNLSHAFSGGTWSVNNSSLATISSTGVLSGATAGQVTVTYTLGGSSTSRTIDVVNLSNLGGLTIVTTGGANEGAGWSYSNGVIRPTSSTAVNVNASAVLSKLNINHLTIEASSITVNSNVTSTYVNDLTLKSSGNILFEGSRVISTTGGDVILWANSDGQTSNGGVFMKQGSGITTNGGHIWMGGGSGSTTWNGLSVGNGYAVSGRSTSDMRLVDWLAGIAFDQINLSTSGGDIYIAGQRNVTSASPNLGAGFINYSGTGTLLDAGTGTITIKGDNRAAGFAFGIMTGLHPNSYTGKFTVKSSKVNSGNAIIIEGTSNAGDGDGFLIENHTRLLSTATTTGGGITISGTSSGNRNAISVGIGSNAGTLEVLSASGLVDVNVGVYPLLIANAGVFRLGSVASDLDVANSSANVVITSNNVNWTGNVPVRTTGTLTVKPTTAGSFATAFNTSALNYTGITGLTIGNSTNTSGITIGSATTIAGPISIFGGAVAVNSPLTATNSTISVKSSTSLTDGTSGYLVANGLALDGTGTVNLDNVNNDVNTIAGGSSGARIGALSFFDKDDLTIGTVNTAGIFSSGDVLVEIGTGDINLSEPVNTTSNTTTATGYAGAIVLNAGKTAAAGTATGGDIKVSGNGAVSAANGITKLYSGKEATSTGLSALVGGSGQERAPVDETTSTFTPSLSATAGSKFALYRSLNSISLTENTITIDALSNQQYTGSAILALPVIKNGGTTLVKDTDYTLSYSANTNVGTATVTATGIGGYSGTRTVNFTITTKPLTITGLTGVNKEYNGNRTATASGTAALTGIIGSDVVTLTGTPTYTFAQAEVGTGIAITTAGYTLTGAAADNYSLTQPSLSANITTKPLTITGLTGVNKEYNGNRTATASGTAALTGIIGSDVVTLTGTPTYTFAQAEVGTGIAITTAGYTLTGAAAGNYSLTQPSLSANITTKALTITGLAGVNKEYNGNRVATASGTAALSGVVGSDVVNLTGSPTYTFAQAEVGTGIAITTAGYTLTGAAAGNYSLTQPSLSANITTKALTITGLAGVNKEYNGNRVATASGTAALSGVVGSDVVNLTGSPTYTFAQAEVGTGIAITTAGYTLTGAAAGNYSLTQPSLSANITTKALTITGLTGVNKEYNGNRVATASGTAALSGVVGSDVVNLTGSPTYTFAQAEVGTGIAITTAGYTLTGAAAGNYSLTQPSLSANITTKALTITGLTGVNKEYNGNRVATASGTAALSGVVGSDVVSLTGTPTYTFAQAEVGTGIAITTAGYTLTGAAAGNYSLTQPSLSANITAKAIAVTPNSNQRKVYGETDPVLTYTFSGAIAGQTPAFDNTLARVQGESAGAYAIGLGSLALKDNGLFKASNYSLVLTAGVDFTIGKAPLVARVNADSKFVTQADASGYAGLSYTGFKFGEDESVLNTANLVISRTNASQQAAGTYSNVLVASGTTAANYTLTYQPGSYTIVAADELLVKLGNREVGYGETPAYQVVSAGYYSSGSQRVVDLTSNTQVQGRKVTVTDGAAGRAEFNIGLSAVVLSGSGQVRVGTYRLVAENTVLTSANFSNKLVLQGNLEVKPKSVGVSLSSSKSKTYDGNVQLSPMTFTLSTPFTGDEVLAAATGVYASKNVGETNYTVSGITLSGRDASNYVVQGGSGAQLTGTDGQITVRSLTVAPTGGQSKVFGGSDPALTYTFSGQVSGEVPGFSGALSRVAGEVEGAYGITRGTLGLVDNGSFLVANYSLVFSTGVNFTIGSKSIAAGSVTVDAITNLVYSGAAQTPAPVVKDGSTTLVAGTDYSLSYSTNTEAGTGVVTITGRGNYTGSRSANFTIEKKAILITPTANQRKVYGDADPSLTYTFSGVVSGQVAAFENTIGRAQGQGAGTYALGLGNLTLKDNGVFKASNYQLELAAVVNFTIDKAPLIAKVNPDSKFVTQADGTGYAGLSYTGFKAGETASVLNATNLVITRTNASQQAAGTYPNVLVATGLSSANYEITYQTGDYTIVGADQLLVKLSPTEVIYGNSPQYQVQQVGYFSSGNQLIVNLTGNAQLNGSRLTVSDGASGTAVFDIAVASAQRSTSTNLKAGNYTLVAENVVETSPNFGNTVVLQGVLKVNPKQLSVTVSGGKVKGYDGNALMQNLALSLSGQIPGDVLAAQGSGQYASKNAGIRGYAVSGITLSGTDAANYFIQGGTNATVQGADGEITKRALTVTPSAGQNKNYGSADSVLTYTVSGQVQGEQLTFSGVLSRASGEAVGNYAITLGTLSAGTNYELVLSSTVQFEIVRVDTDGDGVPDDVEDQEGTDPSDAEDAKDTDGDGVPDYIETQEGTDPTNPTDAKDTDGDGVPDYVEEQQGTNPNNADDVKDTDGDGVPDYTEEQQGTDPADGEDSKDTDGDGVPDYIEEQQGTDPTNETDAKDTDGDGVPDYIETQEGTDPTDGEDTKDTDGDGVPDYVEQQQGTDPTDGEDTKDMDGDGVPDYIEQQQGTNPNNANDAIDSDGDGVPDYVEVLQGTNPTNLGDAKDTDGDGVPDFVEVQQGTNPNNPNDFKDSDGDGVPDFIEIQQGTNPTNANDATDSDGDGVPDFVEKQQGTDPADPRSFQDSDGGGVPDYVEIVVFPRLGLSLTNPANAIDDFSDRDGDGVSDYQEYMDGTDPKDPSSYKDSDGDGVPDQVEIKEGSNPNSASSFKDSDGDGVADYIQIRSFREGAPEDLVVLWGDKDFASKLSNRVLMRTTRNELVSVQVTWDDLSGVNPLARGTYLAKGTITIPKGFFNPYKVKGLERVLVLPKASPLDVTLNNSSFVGSASTYFIPVGAFVVNDPVDKVHVVSLNGPGYDNKYFEIKDNILFWSSADLAAGKTKFSIIVRVTDRDGNTLDKFFEITRTRPSISSLEIANTFTPNGDRFNDTWGIEGARFYTGTKLQIFDRGGVRVFYTEDPKQRWDGTYSGKELATGTYYWTLEVAETGETRRGVLNVMRK